MGVASAIVTPLPAPDPTVSPYTGWTRRHWESLADRMLTAVRPYGSEHHALIDLPGPASSAGRWSDGLEGFARTFLLAGFRLARSGADPHNLAEWYARGLAAGTDPKSPERWPALDEIRQAKVEAASIAIALQETRPWIWDRLDDDVRAQIVDWLARTVGLPMPNNNWIWFQGVTNAFLRSVGGPWSAEDLHRIIELTDEWYAGDGWYSDGNRRAGEYRNYDYYSGWVMQFYPLWFCRMAGADADPALLTRYRERIRRYLQDAQHLVGGDGGPLFQGRSLTYRFAMLSPFWAGAVFDATPLTPGRTRRLGSGVLRRFYDAGCLDDSGLLPIGWHAGFAPIRQRYSGPGSPYWAANGFAGLVLPADHPVWTTVEEPLPVEERDVEFAIDPPGWIVSGTRGDGVVRVVNHGTDHATATEFATDDPVYARHAYATHAAPDMGPDADSAPGDSGVVLLTADGRVSLRRPFERVQVGGRIGISRHRAHWLDGGPEQHHVVGPWITTASVLHGAREVRLARVDHVIQPGPWQLRMTGFPLADARRPQAEVRDGAITATRGDGLTSTAAGLRELPVADITNADDVNPFGRYSVTPWVATAGDVVPGTVYAALLSLSAEVGGTDATSGVGIEVVDDGPGAIVRIDWPDGEHDVLRLDPPSDEPQRSVETGGT
jgi:hypothetical protein